MEPSDTTKSMETPAGFTLRLKLRLGKSAYGFDWSPDGNLFATHDSSHVQIRDSKTGELYRKLETGKQFSGGTTWLMGGDAIASAHLNNDEVHKGLIHIWNVESGNLIRTIPSLTHAFQLAWSSSQQLLVYSQGGFPTAWSAQDHSQHRLSLPFSRRITLSPDGNTLAATISNRQIVFSSLSAEDMVVLPSTEGTVSQLVWSPDSTIIAASVGESIQLVSAKDRGPLQHLEGHSALVSGLSFSADGRLLASKSRDGNIILWRCDTWQPITTFRVSPATLRSRADPNVIVFHPTQSALAILNNRTSELRVWELDLAVLLGAPPIQASVRYTSAKIALVGDSGVGKTGLGWRLAHGDYKQQSSTHGEQLWVLNDLRTLRSDGTQCEAVLWDFAGQPDYRLIHALFLDDADLALLVFDPTNRQESLKGVEYWLKALSHRLGPPCRTILVGARVDVGPPTLTREEIDAFCRHHGISGGYVSTSALKGEGIESLLTRVREQIAWDQKPSTVTTQVFKAIRDSLLLARENVHGSGDGRPARSRFCLLSPEELRNYVLQKRPGLQFSDEELMGAVGNLARHGHVKVLRRSTGSQVILLEPHLLNNLAASFVLEARSNTKGLGALQEDRLLRGEYPFPELASLASQERQTLLDAAVVLFLEKNICFRETLGAETLLLFPALINQKKPHVAEVETVDDVSYTVTGAVQNVYAALVVLLGYTNTFTRTDQWQNQAQYEVGPGELCGFRQVAESEGEIELVLYYGKRVPEHSRLLFQGLFEKILAGRGVKVTRYPPVACPKCGYRPARSEVVNRLRTGKDFLFCGDCAERIVLPRMTLEPTIGQQAPEQLAQDEEAARLRTGFEAALTRVKRFIIERKLKERPSCFISYAWGVPEHERWVEKKLASDLRNAGIQVVLDRWHNASISSDIARFVSTISESDFIAVVGTPLYRQKYENKLPSTGTVVAAEMDLIHQRLTGTESAKRSVLPLLLDGEKETSLPPLMRGRVHGDFRREPSYFEKLLDLILTLYGIPFEEPAIIDLRDSVRSSADELE